VNYVCQPEEVVLTSRGEKEKKEKGKRNEQKIRIKGIEQILESRTYKASAFQAKLMGNWGRRNKQDGINVVNRNQGGLLEEAKRMKKSSKRGS